MAGLRFPLPGFLIFLTLLGPGIAGADRVADLYIAEIPVAGPGAEARAEAIRKAFARVLVKVTGDRNIASQAAATKLLRRAPSYVQQYRYRMLDTARAAKTDSGNNMVDSLLWVSFDERAVNRFLRKNAVPVWGGSRPSTLVWIGLESGGSRRLLQPDQAPALRKAMKRAAASRGLPILMPLMDVEDRGRLQASDVWGGFEENIRRASDRYLPDVILVGRLRKRGGDDWIADWSLYQPDVTNSWQTRGRRQATVAAEGLQRAADELAARYAPQYVTEGTTNLRVRVSGLNHLADYVLVRDYLESLTMIERLDLLAADPEKVSFLARVQGGRDTLERGIQLGGVLEPVVTPDEVVSPESPPAHLFDAESLDYRLR